MTKNKKKIVLDEFHYHEALDRSYIVSNQVEDLLLEHPVIIKHKNLRKRVKRAMDLLTETYQLVGSLGIELFIDKPEK
jgi:hypothetical protein